MTPQQPQPAHGSCQGILDNWNPRKIALEAGDGMREKEHAD